MLEIYKVVQDFWKSKIVDCVDLGKDFGTGTSRSGLNIKRWPRMIPGGFGMFPTHPKKEQQST